MSGRGSNHLRAIGIGGPVPPPVAATRADGSEGIELITEGDALYAAMAQAITEARGSIALASYILAADEVGAPLLELLMARAGAGVDVRVQVDAVGSAGLLPRQWERRLQVAGVRLHRFHRWSWREPTRFNRRDHRKLLAVDGAVAFVGGFNIHRQSSQRHFGDLRWRDTHARLTGTLAADAQVLFDAFWRGDLDWAPPQEAPNAARLLPNTSRRCRRALRCAYRDAIADATKRVWLTTPYFVPDRGLRRLLGAAARRGVDVRILTTRPTDVRLVRWAAHAAYPELLAQGVRVYEYLPRLLHAKTLVIDEGWTCIGTANFDYRSLFINYEVSLLTANSLLAQELAGQFLSDLGEAEEVTPSIWRRRTPLDALAASVGHLVRRWL